MLIKDPARRPSMRKILEKDFLSRRISKLLTTTIAKNEFTSTFINRHLNMPAEAKEEDKEQCNDVSNEGVS
jgi:L-lysine 2,3-aminomutase